jgi:hypothetical protein
MVNLRFGIIEATGMSLSLGDIGWHESSFDSSSQALGFSIRPCKYPDTHQEIWLVSEKIHKADATETTPAAEDQRRLLTDKIRGALYLRKQPPEFKPRPPFDSVSKKIKNKTAPRTPIPCIGYLTYVPEYLPSEWPDKRESEFYEITVSLPEKEFTEIRNLFASGKSPTAITIHTPDIEYGYGSETKLWDISFNQVADIVGVSIGFSIEAPRVMVGAKKTEDEQEQQAEEEKQLKQAVIESRQDIQLLCYGMYDIKTALGKLQKQLNILIVLIVVIGAFLVLRFKL